MYSTLYHTLSGKIVPEIELNDDQLRKLKNYLNRLKNKDTMQNIYFLLVEHHYQQTKEFEEFPYESKQTSEGYIFELTSLPSELQKLLWSFYQHQTNK